jgi:hypothetical protein
MHAKNFCSEFLDIFKNDFRPMGAYAPMSQIGFPVIIMFFLVIYFRYFDGICFQLLAKIVGTR